jgi:uncharacterized protein
MEWLSGLLGIEGIILVTVTMVLGAALQGSVGYGMALLVSPILVLVDPRLIPGPYIVASQLLSILMIVRERRSVDFRGIKWAVLGRIPGTILAGYMLATISESAMILTFGILVLFGVLISIAGWRFPPQPKNLFFAGVLSAIMGTVATIGGPPMALVYQDAKSDELRSTLSGYFIIGALFSIFTLYTIGRLGEQELRLSILLLPGILFGYLVSSRLLPLLKQKYTRLAVLAIATASGLFVILRELLG